MKGYLRQAAAAVLLSAALAAPGAARGEVRVYPNPVHTAAGQTEVVFDGFPTAAIEIYSRRGDLVRKAQAAAEFRWDLRNDSGKTVASGIYFYLVDQPGGIVTGKIVVIR